MKSLHYESMIEDFETENASVGLQNFFLDIIDFCCSFYLEQSILIIMFVQSSIYEQQCAYPT